jgi:CheY-like chemotaxis protein
MADTKNRVRATDALWSLRVWIVDDEKTERDKIEAVLREKNFSNIESGSHQVHPVQEAIAAGKGIMIADHSMPIDKDKIFEREEVTDGLTLLQYIREEMNCPSGSGLLLVLYTNQPLSQTKKDLCLRHDILHLDKLTTTPGALVAQIVDQMTKRGFGEVEELTVSVAFLQMLAPLLNDLESPEKRGSVIDSGAGSFSYAKMAELIRSGDPVGLEYALDWYKAERYLIQILEEKNMGND